mmetsp:Transcript_124880/g.349788  ORF Transcript_124880/g.349788 Transcript_124880/m.349788 type:complete len:240 (-) Transcript_124880:482-1201(-)
MVLVQHLHVEPSVHALAGSSRGEGAAAPEEHVQHGRRRQHRPVPPALHLPTEHQVAEGVRLGDPDVAAGVARGLDGPRGARLQGAIHADLSKAARRPLAEIIEVDIDADEDQPVRPALPADVLPDVLHREFREILLVSVQGVAQCVAFVCGGVEQLADQTLDVFLELLPHLHGLPPRRLDLLLQDRRAEDVREHEGQNDGHILPQRIKVVQDVLAPHTARRTGAELFQGLQRAQVAQMR